MNKKSLGIFLVFVALACASFAQGRKGIRINEVLVNNEANYQDDYGCLLYTSRCV